MSNLLDFSDDLIIYTDTNGKILEVNESYLDLLHLNQKEILGKSENKILNIISSSQKVEEYEKLLLGKLDIVIEEIIEFEVGIKYYKTKKELIEPNKILITRRDITEYKQYLSLYNSHIYLLELIAKAKPIEYILDEIIKSVEKRNSNMICSVLLYNSADNKLYKGAAPSLPDDYNDKLNGMIIGEKVGSCGAAVYLKERVIVEDISKHENWQKAKNFAAKFNLRACWSQPILSSNDEILGSFAIYYKKPKSPTKFDIDLIEDVANVAGVAIDKHLQTEQLQKEIEENKKQEQLLMHKSKQAMMGEMLENIAHQWRQPLSIISTYATGILIKKESGMDTKDMDKEAFEVINVNAQYLSNTIENFRKYFMSNSKKVDFTLKESIDYTLKLVEGRVKAEDIKIIYDVNDVALYNYRNELTQVFMNILNNSADALNNIHRQDRYIQITSELIDGFVRVYIIDSAKGAPDNIVERIFEPYFTTKHQSCGTGIGLYMCHEIIDKHVKGSIKAYNDQFSFAGEDYRGLKFVIDLPIEGVRVDSGLDYVI